MIRATISQTDKPVYALAWGPDNTSVPPQSAHKHGKLGSCA
jgi:hypothetical protein